MIMNNRIWKWNLEVGNWEFNRGQFKFQKDFPETLLVIWSHIQGCGTKSRNLIWCFTSRLNYFNVYNLRFFAFMFFWNTIEINRCWKRHSWSIYKYEANTLWLLSRSEGIDLTNFSSSDLQSTFALVFLRIRLRKIRSSAKPDRVFLSQTS